MSLSWDCPKPNVLCIVCASCPVASVILLEAFADKLHKANLQWFLYKSIIPFILTVLPQPAFDVIIVTPLVDANKVREQITPIDKPVLKEVHGELSDICYMFRNDREQIRDIMIKQYLKYIEEVGIENCVIIVPRKQDCTNSIREINKTIQDKLINSNVKSLNRGDTLFKVGARVIQKVNNADKDVINGELGYIIAIYEQIKDDKKKNFFTIKFDNNKEVEYEQGDLGDIELGYALTVHSSQGSEYHTVIVGTDSTHFNLLSSNLLYTAITRAKSRCLVVTEPSAFQQCIRKKTNRRKTWLNQKFKIDVI